MIKVGNIAYAEFGDFKKVAIQMKNNILLFSYGMR